MEKAFTLWQLRCKHLEKRSCISRVTICVAHKYSPFEAADPWFRASNGVNNFACCYHFPTWQFCMPFMMVLGYPWFFCEVSVCDFWMGCSTGLVPYPRTLLVLRPFDCRKSPGQTSRTTWSGWSQCWLAIGLRLTVFAAKVLQLFWKMRDVVDKLGLSLYAEAGLLPGHTV